MDPSSVLLLSVALHCVLALVILLRSGRRPVAGWITIYLCLLAALATTPLVGTQRAGLWIPPLWALLAVVPALAAALVGSSLQARRYRLARGLAQLASWLHPMDGWLLYPRFVDLCRAAHAGDRERLQAELETLRRGGPSPFAGAAESMALAVSQDWSGFLGWVESQPEIQRSMSDPSVLASYLAALGNLDRHAELVRAYAQHGPALMDRIPGPASAIVRLSFAVQCGQVAAVRRLLEGPLSGLDAGTKALQLGIVLQVAGQGEAAARELESALADQRLGAVQRQRAQALLAQPRSPFDAESCSPAELEVLADFERASSEESRYSISAAKRRRPWATYALAAILLVVYALELPGGSTDTNNLVRMGALVVPRPADSSWWDYVAAGFLHFGHAHLIFNLAGLALLGTWLERQFGPLRMLLVYFASLLASTGFYPYFVQLTEERPVQVLVGASGGVLGLLGALLARAALARLRHRNRVLGRQLGFLAGLLALQLGFDQLVPEISSTAHLLGAGTGLALGLLLALGESREPRATQQAS